MQRRSRATSLPPGSSKRPMIRSRQNSLFELVETPERPARPDRPQSLAVDGSNYSMSSPQEMPIDYLIQQDFEAERQLRIDLLRRLAVMSETVLHGVDIQAIQDIADHPNNSPVTSPQPNAAAAPLASPKMQPTAKQKTKRNIFGFKVKHRKASSDPTPSSVMPKAAGPVRDQRPTRSKQEVFGVALSALPPGASCMSVIGGQHHVIPIWAFVLVEEMYGRGLGRPGLFRITGYPGRVRNLADMFGSAPLYGDQVNLKDEPMDNIATLFRRFLEAMPDPVFDSRLFTLFQNCCLRDSLAVQDRIVAAQTILRLLPRANFSLFVYLVAFLCQVMSHPENGLSEQDLAILLGPAMFAPRVSRSLEQTTNADLRASEAILQWILSNWIAICGASIAADKAPTPQLLQPPSSEASPQESLFADYYAQQNNGSADETPRSQPGIALGTPSSSTEMLAQSKFLSNSTIPEEEVVESEQPSQVSRRRSLSNPQSVPDSLGDLASSFPMPAQHYEGRLSVISGSTDGAQQVASPQPVWRDIDHERKPVFNEMSSQSDHSYVSVENFEPTLESDRSLESTTAKLPPSIPYSNARVSSRPPQLPPFPPDSPTTNITDQNLMLSPFAPNHVGSSVGDSVRERGSIRTKGTSISSHHNLPLDSKTNGHVASSNEPIEKHLAESIAFHETLKHDNLALMKRIEEQEQEMARQRQLHVEHVSTCSNDVLELRSALQKAQQRRFDEEDSLVKEYKHLAFKAEEQANISREQSLAEMQRLLGMVQQLTKEKDLANKRLKAVKRALSCESLALSRRTSLIIPPNDSI